MDAENPPQSEVHHGHAPPRWTVDRCSYSGEQTTSWANNGVTGAARALSWIDEHRLETEATKDMTGVDDLSPTGLGRLDSLGPKCIHGTRPRSRRGVLRPSGAIPVPQSGDVVRIGIPVGGW